MTPPRLPTASSNSRPGPKRPPVNAAPAEIVAPISLRRVRPGEQAVQAGNGSNGTSAARNAPVASASGGKGGVKRGQVQPIGQKDARDLPARPEVPRQPVASTSDGTSRSRHSLAERILPRDPEESREQDGRGQAGGRDDARGETNGRGRGRGRGGGGAVRGGQGGGRGGGHSHGRENGRAAAHGGNPRPRTKDPRLLRLGELASWVLVDNKAVPLYKTESEGPMKLTCYLEAVEGAEFAVGFRDERERGEDDAADFLCEVIVDGVVCGADRQIIRAWKKSTMWNSRDVVKKRSYTWRGRSESATSLRPFVFSPLALTSDPDSASHLTESQLRSLGSIQLRIYRGRVGEAADEGMNAGDADGGEGKGLGETKLWEESKKLGLSHQASLGPARQHSAEKRSVFVFDEKRFGDRKDKPYAVLEFKYRSRTVLEIEGMVEAQDDTPPAAPAPRTSNSRSASASSSSNAATAPPAHSTRSTTSQPKPKPNPKSVREESPVLARPRSPDWSAPGPSKSQAKSKGKGKEEVKPSVAKGKKRVQPPPLGEVVLDTSDVEMIEEDENDLYGEPPVTEKKAGATGATTKKGKSKVGDAEDPDAEIARLRAELAEYKARELAQLRREKEEVERRVKAREEDEVRRAIEGRKRERREEEEVAQQLLRRRAGVKREKEDVDAVLVLSDGSDDD
ncbi:hypothetical protein NBRC10512_005625 [Rhodotorula toruloides]|uniref:RHTO0S15e01156g1_1 n=2 Tax=Rhodotorula toruloides TaxID=5286 RepID=A0A061BKY7_RHOTO|nr:uncharacterized protein RHTO_03254 [Rhodotorula toruloides NP11]EMS25525.1 hypothetical protein RHTO_03254 [Rhodotorula toruloides NP11]CDR47730.1 RHTO0S15e01156g1_1 [Rhodotorula toruloides]